MQFAIKSKCKITDEIGVKSLRKTSKQKALKEKKGEEVLNAARREFKLCTTFGKEGRSSYIFDNLEPVVSCVVMSVMLISMDSAGHQVQVQVGKRVVRSFTHFAVQMCGLAVSRVSQSSAPMK